MLQSDRFQYLLRQFGGPLSAAEVKPLSEDILTAPHQVKVCFPVSIHGSPEFVEAEMDLRSVQRAEDVVAVAGKLLSALEQRAAAKA